MNNIINVATNSLLVPSGLDDNKLERVLHSLLVPGIDYADLYFQEVYNESWVLDEGLVKEGHFSIDRGVGVRAVSEEKTGFAYADDIFLHSLEEAATAARSIVRSSIQLQQATKIGLKKAETKLYSAENPLQSLTEQQKIQLLQEIDSYARQADSRVKQVIASLAGEYEIIYIFASDGTIAADIRPLVRLNVEVIVEHNNRRERGSMGGGGRFDYTYFGAHELAKAYAEEAVRQALVNLEAVPAPAGLMTVVLAPGWPGVLLHEAVGHGLEGDFNRKGSSSYSGRIGEKVASSLCTIVDDGTIENRRGSLHIDDEGTPTQHNVLIEKGILKNYMQDKLNARLMKTAPTGNGRRESYAHLPMPRMTNTFMLPGQQDPAEIIASVERGLYAVNFGGGQVDITSGKFVFSASEAYLIEKGKVTAPVKGATLIGNGPEVLNAVSMVGNDLKLDSGVGTCGKEGQSVPVGVGQPTLKIDQITVGGTQ